MTGALGASVIAAWERQVNGLSFFYSFIVARIGWRGLAFVLWIGYARIVGETRFGFGL